MNGEIAAAASLTIAFVVVVVVKEREREKGVGEILCCVTKKSRRRRWSRK